MPLDPTVVGAESSEYRMSYDWKTLVLYALGIGARTDELDYVYEARGPKVFPTFGVVPSYPVLMDLLGRSGGRLDRLVHGGQSVKVAASLPPSGELSTRGSITGIYDMKRLGQMVFQTRTFAGDRLVYETEWQMLFIGEGGFGGSRPPRSDVIAKRPADVEPAFCWQEKISEEQALLYRLSGDPNPLHVDPAFAASMGFERGPILHGLATFGFCARALSKAALDGDASRISAFHAQFRQPVWPGEVLETTGYRLGERYVLEARAGGRSEVAALCTAEVGGG